MKLLLFGQGLELEFRVDEEIELKAWSFLQISNLDGHFANNDGYRDFIGSHYRWDSTVANHRGPALNDRILVRNSDFVIGMSVIQTLKIIEGTKRRYRCPRCTSTKFSKRSTLMPMFRCAKCRHEFNERNVEDVAVYEYTAFYSDQWREVRNISVFDISTLYLANAKQNAIRELRLKSFLDLQQSLTTSHSAAQP